MKVPKDRVHYTEMASDASTTCETCKLFRQPASCFYVAGEIAPRCSWRLRVAAQPA